MAGRFGEADRKAHGLVECGIESNTQLAGCEGKVTDSTAQIDKGAIKLRDLDKLTTTNTAVGITTHCRRCHFDGTFL